MFTTGVTHECECAAGFTKTLYADIEGSTPRDFTYYSKDGHKQITCTDSDYGFTGACFKGWTGTGVDCIDFVESEDQKVAGYSFNAQGNSWFGNALGRINSFIGLGQDFIPCDDRVFCTEGSYPDQCLDGLTSDGYTCEDVDEYSATLNACAALVDIDEDTEGSRSVKISICSNIDVTDGFGETWTKGYS